MGQKMEMKYNFSEEIFCIATQTNVRTFRLNETVQGTFYPLASRGVKKNEGEIICALDKSFS